MYIHNHYRLKRTTQTSEQQSRWSVVAALTPRIGTGLSFTLFSTRLVDQQLISTAKQIEWTQTVTKQTANQNDPETLVAGRQTDGQTQRSHSVHTRRPECKFFLIVQKQTLLFTQDASRNKEMLRISFLVRYFYNISILARSCKKQTDLAGTCNFIKILDFLTNLG